MSLAAAPASHQPVPRLAEPFEPAPGDATGPIAASPPSSQEPRTNSADVADTSAAGEKKQPKKRSFFGFVKHKKPDSQPTTNKAAPPSPAPSDPTSPQSLVQPTQPINFPAAGSGARQQQHTAAAMPPAPTSHPTAMGSPALSPPMPAAATPSSPRLSSPAGSQIFERDVQESASVLSPSSPAIPSHIQTENYIPPVLDASSEAITDDQLDPDTVEIITASAHQPAGLAVGAAGSGSGSPPIESPRPSWTDELAAFAAAKERASSRDLHSETSGPHSNNNASGMGSLANNYGSLDSTDVRRLSFISFADVVQAEHQHHQAAGAMGASGTLVLPGSRESMASTSQQTQTTIQQTCGQPLSQSSSPGGQPPAWQANSPQLPQLPGHLASLAAVRNRSPSPFRSPPAAAGVGGVGVIAGSPPTSKSGSIHGLDMSPGRRTMGSPTLTAAGLSISGASVSSGSAAELTIETMSQALRKTGSGDLGSGTLRSHPTSPI